MSVTRVIATSTHTIDVLAFQTFRLNKVRSMTSAAFNIDTYSQIVAAYYGLIDVTIRPAQKSDFAHLTQIQVRALCNSGLGGDGSSTIQRYVERHLRQTQSLCTSSSFFVAVINQTVVGCGGWTIVGVEAGSMPCAVGFYVDPPFGGRKIGRGLLAVTEASAKKGGVALMTAFPPLHGTDMFRNAGYSVKDVVPFALGDNLSIELLMMRKRLQG